MSGGRIECGPRNFSTPRVPLSGAQVGPHQPLLHTETISVSRVLLFLPPLPSGKADAICTLPEWQPDAVEDTVLPSEALSDSLLDRHHLRWLERHPSSSVCCCPKCFSLQQGSFVPAALGGRLLGSEHDR